MTTTDRQKELTERKNEIVSEFKAFQQLIKEAYESMQLLSDEYQRIEKELGDEQNNEI